MTSDQAALWRRIQDFDLDGPERPAVTFLARLARDNGWTHLIAQQAIHEYKRYVFLAMTAGHVVCPSEQVDQVWHLHLTYTRSYWDRLCKEVLGRPLHHDPTRGGHGEAVKHDQMYEATLASYRKLFGIEPPAEFWPPSAIRFGEDTEHRHVNVRQNWIIPKGRIKRLLGTSMLLMLAAIACGCVAPLVGNAQAKREEWLLIYALAFAAAFCISLVIRRMTRQPSDPIDAAEANLDRYDRALLAGGPIRVYDTCLVHLCEESAIKFNGVDKFHVSGPLPKDADPIEGHVYSLVAYGGESGRLIEVMRKDVKLDLDARKASLQEKGLLRTTGSIAKGCILPMMLILPVIIGIGMIRTAEGYQAKTPSCFILSMTLAFLILSAKVFCNPNRRTYRGDQYLKDVFTQYGTDRPRRDDGTKDLVMATALLGTGALVATEYDLMQRALHPKMDPTASGSGCGGGGCGGGGGGGGGGCGGGGCGGGGGD